MTTATHTSTVAHTRAQLARWFKTRRDERIVMHRYHVSRAFVRAVNDNYEANCENATTSEEFERWDERNKEIAQAFPEEWARWWPVQERL